MNLYLRNAILQSALFILVCIPAKIIMILMQAKTNKFTFEFIYLDLSVILLGTWTLFICKHD